ncbi:MAG: hypothetical protein HC890_19965 [Chloroflexaceae bacterium]|nr:hypothetical protein [Chloroflexaceae bacterium]
MSDKEKIESVFNYQNARSNLYVDIPGEGLKLYPHTKYKNFDKYLEIHPACCKVDPGGPYEVGQSFFEDRILGYDSGDVIVIDFEVRYWNNKDQRKSKKERFENTLTNCGIVRD